MIHSHLTRYIHIIITVLLLLYNIIIITTIIIFIIVIIIICPDIYIYTYIITRSKLIDPLVLSPVTLENQREALKPQAIGKLDSWQIRHV